MAALPQCTAAPQASPDMRCPLRPAMCRNWPPSQAGTASAPTSTPAGTSDLQLVSSSASFVVRVHYYLPCTPLMNMHKVPWQKRCWQMLKTPQLVSGHRAHGRLTDWSARLAVCRRRRRISRVGLCRESSDGVKQLRWQQRIVAAPRLSGLQEKHVRKRWTCLVVFDAV